MSTISRSFYQRDDVVQIAKELLGTYLFTVFDQKLTGGMITETEAYAGINDKASHAYGNRRTSRTEVMYAKGGTTYVYLCYGIYPLFNVVTNKKEIPHAILIRGIKPIKGIDFMLERIGKREWKETMGNGPGKVTKLLGITCRHTGIDLIGHTIWLEHRKHLINDQHIISTSRVGIDYAAEDALLPYRFILQE